MNGETYSFTHAWQPLAATCSHSSGRQWPPVAAIILFSSAATCTPLRPMSGRQWPPAFSSHRQPLAATCSQSSGRQRPPVSASANRVAASVRQWPPAFGFSSAATCSHLQPLEWPPVAARILFSSATTCSHLQPKVAARASGRKWPPEQVAASGRKWPPVPKSNSCPSARSLVFQVFVVENGTTLVPWRAPRCCRPGSADSNNKKYKYINTHSEFNRDNDNHDNLKFSKCNTYIHM